MTQRPRPSRAAPADGPQPTPRQPRTPPARRTDEVPAGTKAAGTKPAGTKTAGTKTAGTKTAGTKPAGGEPPSADGPTGLKLLMAAGRPRASRGQLVVALLCALLGFALVTQVHSQSGAGLSSARQADLVDVLDNLSAKSDQLRSQINQEQDVLSKLTGGADQNQAALDEAEQRAATLRILAGTVGATGPGIDLRISDPQHKVTADVLLDTLEELRDAGAEAIEIRGSAAAAGNSPSPTSRTATPGASGGGTPGGPLAVRLVASSYFVDSQDGNGVVADGTLLAPPYDILAIADPATLSQAMAIPGGVLDTLKAKGASGAVTQLDAVRVTALHVLTPPKYAHPAASPSSAS
jgi:uncharacterized protein YlxW (UPF0749 family)